ncbi:MAG: hypothetical protein WB611_04925 [Stellaceae bacterium]
MSWRDRLARHDLGTDPDADGTPPKASGTIGAIGNKEISATASDGGGTEDCRVNHVSSPDVLRSPLADSAKSVNRARTSVPIAGVDAVSAESANRTDDACPIAKQRDANSAESAIRAGLDDSSWHDDHEERAAIWEHYGEIPRDWAEGFARLDPDHPPGDVPLRRWQTFVDDFSRFLDDGWAEKAVALGWGPLDLFGADRDKPFARIDQSGLIWLLHGDRLIAGREHCDD